MTTPGARRWRLVRAMSTSVPASVRRFNARARGRRIRSARPWFAAAALVALAGLVGWLFYGTSVFGVAHIEVSGAGFVSADEIRTAAGVATGTPLASVDTGSVATHVARLAGVAHATVARDWPSTLVIDVTLRVAVAAVPQPDPQMHPDTAPAGGFILVDAGGVAFRTVPQAPDGLMVIVLATPGRGDPSTRAALTVLAALPAALRDQVLRMTAAAPAEIQLVLANDRVIIWGDSSDNGPKARVALSLLRNPGKVIDVSAPNVVTVR